MVSVYVLLMTNIIGPLLLGLGWYRSVPSFIFTGIVLVLFTGAFDIIVWRTWSLPNMVKEENIV